MRLSKEEVEKQIRARFGGVVVGLVRNREAHSVGVRRPLGAMLLAVLGIPIVPEEGIRYLRRNVTVHKIVIPLVILTSKPCGVLMGLGA